MLVLQQPVKMVEDDQRRATGAMHHTSVDGFGLDAVAGNSNSKDDENLWYVSSILWHLSDSLNVMAQFFLEKLSFRIFIQRTLSYYESGNSWEGGTVVVLHLAHTRLKGRLVDQLKNPINIPLRWQKITKKFIILLFR